MLEPIWIIESLTESNRKNKKYKIVFYNIDSFNRITSHFGSKNSETFLDHKDESKKKNYIKRHAPNESKIWFDKTKWFAPASLSVRLLWNKPTLKESLKEYKKHYNLIR